MNNYLLLLLTSCILALTACQSENETKVETTEYVHIPPSLPENIYEKLEPGDCIIRKGNGPLSYHLMNSTKEDYSHGGIIIQEAGKWKVIHTIGGSSSSDEIDGIQVIDLREFVAHAADSMLYICRPIFKDSAGHQVAEQARFYLDEQIPFDHGFSMFSEDKWYCTELLYYIFKDVNGKNVFDIKKKHKSYMLMFSTFFKEEYFKPLFHLKPNKEDWYVLKE
ncbi:MAG: YiiX/YebB-like N1pC/P60 family cysteine hydrolase [Crocinitomicaceae bacterium]